MHYLVSWDFGRILGFTGVQQILLKQFFFNETELYLLYIFLRQETEWNQKKVVGFFSLVQD